MTDDTRNCDEVADHLRDHYPEFSGKDEVLVVDTKNNGAISEASTGKSKEELDRMRAAATTIDDPTNPSKAIVSVMVLREGWDVQNVVAIVGLRPYTSKARILPEQTLGRGLRRMFRGDPVQERVSIIGTAAFIEFVESIKVEGVELEYAPMGGGSGPKSPIVVEVDRENADKDIDSLDIDLPLLAPRIQREYKNLADLDPSALAHKRVPVLSFTEEQQREIVFRDLNTDEQSHVTSMDRVFTPNYQNMIGFFARSVMRDLRLVGGFDVLFAKIKQFVEFELFEHPVDLEDLNILRNLSEIEATRTLAVTMKGAVNALTVLDSGTTEVRGSIRVGKTRPFLVKEQAFFVPKRSVFNKIVGDSGFELDMAAFLDGCGDVISFIKNNQNTNFRIEYCNADGSISNYYPDFIVKRTEAEIWIVETKGRQDLNDPLKWERLGKWCEDATAHDDGKRRFHPLLVLEEDWNAHKVTSFGQLVTACG